MNKGHSRADPIQDKIATNRVKCTEYQRQFHVLAWPLGHKGDEFGCSLSLLTLTNFPSSTVQMIGHAD